MTCRRCGKRCQGRYCQSCGRDEHREQSLETDDDESSTDKITYECCECGGRYRAESPGCPHCGYYGGRYAGDDAGEPALVTDGGVTIDDYVDLGEKYDQRFDRPDYCRCAEQLVENAVCCACSQAGFGTPNPEAFAGGGD